MEKFLLLLLVIIIIFTGCSTANTIIDKYDVGQLEISQEIIDKRIEDVNFIYDCLKQRHPNPYYKTSEDDFLKQKQEILANIETYCEQTFYLKLTQWIASLHDVHTKIAFNNENTLNYKLTTFPIQFIDIDDNYVVFIINKENEKYLGYKLTAINNMPIADVKEKLSKLVSYEENAGKYNYLDYTLNYPHVLNYVGIIDDINHVEYSLTNVDGETKKLKLSLKNENQKYEYIRYDIEKIPSTYFVRYFTQKYHYGVDELNSDTLYIYMNQSVLDYDYRLLQLEEDVKNYLSKNNYKKIVIDNRKNVGGASFYFERLFNQINEYQKNTSCEVYTIIDKYDVSAGAGTALDAKNIIANNTIVGSTTGGVVNCFAGQSKMKLPNSPLIFCYSTSVFTMSAQRPNYNQVEGAVYPDIEIKQTYEDFIDGIDTLVEAILKM